MNKIDYQALREAAEQATKGSYIVGHTSGNQHGNITGVFVCQKWKGEPGGVIAECHVNCLVETDVQAYANAEFIAAFNPNVALALLDERDALNERLAELEADLAGLAEDHQKATESIKQADAAVKLAHEKFSALAAENAGLKDTLSAVIDRSNEPDYQSIGMGCGVEDNGLQTDGYNACEYGWREAMDRIYSEVIPDTIPETPATDAFLAEVRAHDLNAFIRHHSAELDAHIKNGGEQFDEKSVRIRDIIVSARLFREQIRKGGRAMSNIDKHACDMEREYFILSTAHTQRGDPYITLWAADDSGYRCRCHTAGRYSESHVLSNLGYYNNGAQTVAVPCDVAEPLSHSVAKGFFDDNDGRWLRNNSATWKELLKHVIAAPKHTPAPEYRGAPRKVED